MTPTAMSAPTARKVVLMSMLGTAGIVVVRNASVGGIFPVAQSFIALAVVYVVLSFLADTVPKIAGPFALLIFLSMLLSGKAALTAISNLVKGD